jgi:hypothetical protein
MENGKEVVEVMTAQAVVMAPQFKFTEIVEAKKDRDKLISSTLEENVDYGVIPGTRKPTLLKPGAEQIAGWYNCSPTFKTIDKTIDVENGIYRYVRSCKLIHRTTGVIVGEGSGACSTTENKFSSNEKYPDRSHGMENTILKMADKRALVAVVLITFALSGRFTQDLEDMERPETPRDQHVGGKPFQDNAPDTYWTFKGKDGNQTIGAVSGKIFTEAFLNNAGFKQGKLKKEMWYAPYQEATIAMLKEMPRA